MKGLILAAGRGSRMRELTLRAPKCLTELFGKTLLDYQISAFQKAGITEIAIVTGYLKEQIVDKRLFHKFENPEWETTNMVQSLVCAKDWLLNETCIISYSDIFYEFSAIKTLMQSPQDIAITFDKNFLSLWSVRFKEPLVDLERFKVSLDFLIQDIGGQASDVNEIQGQFMGLIKCTPHGWQQIQSVLSEQNTKNLDVTSLLQALIQRNIPVGGVPYDGIWGEIDQISDLRLYENWDWRMKEIL